MNYISPTRAGDAMLTTLALAEMYQQWKLFEAVVNYIRASDGVLHYAGPQQYVITYPDPTSKG